MWGIARLTLPARYDEGIAEYFQVAEFDFQVAELDFQVAAEDSCVQVAAAAGASDSGLNQPRVTPHATATSPEGGETSRVTVDSPRCVDPALCAGVENHCGPPEDFHDETDFAAMAPCSGDAMQDADEDVFGYQDDMGEAAYHDF